MTVGKYQRQVFKSNDTKFQQSSLSHLWHCCKNFKYPYYNEIKRRRKPPNNLTNNITNNIINNIIASNKITNNIRLKNIN